MLLSRHFAEIQPGKPRSLWSLRRCCKAQLGDWHAPDGCVWPRYDTGQFRNSTPRDAELLTTLVSNLIPMATRVHPFEPPVFCMLLAIRPSIPLRRNSAGPRYAAPQHRHGEAGVITVCFSLEACFCFIRYVRFPQIGEGVY